MTIVLSFDHIYDDPEFPYVPLLVMVLNNKGLEVCKSGTNPIRSDFGTKILISDWIGLEKLFRSRIGFRHWTSITFSVCHSFIYFTKHFHFH